MTERAFVALGSNLNDPVVQVGRALEALAALPPSSNLVLLIEPIAGLGMYMQAMGRSQADHPSVSGT